jgi:hypothetical protein
MIDFWSLSGAWCLALGVSKSLLPGLAIFAILDSLPSRAADQLTRFDARPGSKVRVEGTSSIHDWQLEAPFVGGFIAVGPGFPVEPGQEVKPGKFEAQAEVFIPVRQLKSVEKNGAPYSDKMDEIVWEKLNQPKQPKIFYRLSELVLKELPKSKDLPYTFDSQGELVVGGVTNKISMPVFITPLGGKKLKIAGTVTVKMTDFGIKPPAPALALGLISTGDEVKLFFEWIVAEKPAPAPEGTKP